MMNWYDSRRRVWVGLCLIAVMASGCGLAGATPSAAPTSQRPPAVATVIAGPTATAALATAVAVKDRPVEFVRVLDTTANPVRGPMGLAVDRQGNLFIVDSDNDRIQKYDRDGRFVQAWGSGGTGDGQFQFSTRAGRMGGNIGFVAVDQEGFVYATDWKRIQKFDGNGRFLAAWTMPDASGQAGFNLGPIAVDRQGTLYAGPPGVIHVLDTSGQLRGTIDRRTDDGPLSEFAAVEAIDGQGNRYIGDNGRDRILKISSAGAFITAWGGTGAGDGQLQSSTTMALDSREHLYVADTPNKRVIKFDPSGQWLGSWRAIHDGGIEFANPFGIAIDDRDTIYVSDSDAHKVYVFRRR